MPQYSSARGESPRPGEARVDPLQPRLSLQGSDRLRLFEGRQDKQGTVGRGVKTDFDRDMPVV